MTKELEALKEEGRDQMIKNGFSPNQIEATLDLIDAVHALGVAEGRKGSIEEVLKLAKNLEERLAKLEESKILYNQRDHTHCKDQEIPACGIPKEKHTRCCLCGVFGI